MHPTPLPAKHAIAGIQVILVGQSALASQRIWSPPVTSAKAVVVSTQE
jgi:hypothetical protein